MKKYMIIVVSFAVLAAGLTLGVRTYNRSNENRLLMANIDALTNPEDDGGNPPSEEGPFNKGTTISIEYRCPVYEYNGHGGFIVSWIYKPGKGCSFSENICTIINPCY